MTSLREIFGDDTSLHEVEELQSNQTDPIPEGEYVLAATRMENKPNAKGTGTRLDILFSVQDGPLTGRGFFMSYNLNHENRQAQNIARDHFKKIVDATGVSYEAVQEDIQSILHQPFVADVVCKSDEVKNEYGQRVPKINPSTGKPYPPRNSFIACKPVGGYTAPPVNSAPRPAAPPSTARPAAPNSDNPWTPPARR